jgi:murein DD-endopeptidase MepM/ murein hydrolase activator NlpD
LSESPGRVQTVIEAAERSPSRGDLPPRWLLAAFIIVVGAGLMAGGALLGEYATLQRQRSLLATVDERLGGQQALIESQRSSLDSQRRLLERFEERVKQIRAEVDSWRAIQTRLWKPFGPDLGPPVTESGVGGTAIRHREPPARPQSLLQEIENLAETVADTGEGFRAFDQFIVRASGALASLPARWPVRGPVNSEFGVRRSPWGTAGELHSGLDIGTGPGTPVVAPAAGTVVFAGPQGDYGLTLIIDHGNEIRSVYAHLARVAAAVDQKVEPGQVIAHTGSTGRSTGPHLHYEIQVQGQAVNPRTFIWN